MTAMFDDLMKGLDEVDTFLSGETTGYKVNVPAEVDVKVIRKKLNMTQARFSDTFGFSLDAVKHWEGGRRTPESSARAYLTVIARNPAAVLEALQPESKARVALKHSNKRHPVVHKTGHSTETKTKARNRAHA